MEPLTCAHCGAPMYRAKGSLPQGLATCRPCRRAARVTCRECGAAMIGTARGSLPQGQATCQACRLAGFAAARSCPDCSGPKDRRSNRCADCGHKAQRVRADDDPRTERRAREYAAPGISRPDRYRLLSKWRRQARACVYCGAPATTIDHVVPLIRGGSNYEGNLAPACARCNFRKGPLLLVEVKAGRRRSVAA